MRDPKPGPVKSWSDMTPAEREQVAASIRPPVQKPAPVLPFRCERCQASGREGSVQTSALCRVRETEKAVLYLFSKDAGGEVWVPKSVLVSVDGDEVPLNHSDWSRDDWGSREAPVELEVRRWWVEKQGLAW